MPEAARISISLPPAIAEMAFDLARTEGRSHGSICAYAIEAWLHAHYSERIAIYQQLEALKPLHRTYLPAGRPADG